jgi:uncharacterized protein YegP (UPF0339 family)
VIYDERGSMLTPLREIDFFRKVFIEFGALTWPNGFDIAPDALYAKMKQEGRLTGAVSGHASPTMRARAKMPFKFEVYKDKAGEFRFRIKAPNGEIICASKGYKSKASALSAIELIKRGAPDAVVDDQAA